MLVNGSWKWHNNGDSSEAYFSALNGRIINYKPDYSVDLRINGTTIPNIAVNANGTFALVNLDAYPFPFTHTDLPLTITYTDSLGYTNSMDTVIAVDQLTSNRTIGNGGITIYPNPATDLLNIDLGLGYEEATVKIYNAMGKLYHYENFQKRKNTIDLTHLEKGIYFVTITDKRLGTICTKKIVITKSDEPDTP